MSLSPISHTRRATAVFLGLVAAATVAPSGAQAAAFGQPIKIAGNVETDGIQMAIAPNGRTAVMFARDVSKGRRTRFGFRVAIGPSPDRLGAGTKVPGVGDSSYVEGGPQLLARPDGGFVACYQDDSRRATTTAVCSTAPPTGGFGPPTVVRRIARKDAGGITAAMRADGTTVLLLTRLGAKINREKRRTYVGVSTLDAAGVVSPARETERTDIGTYAVTTNTPLAVGPDGTVAIPAGVEQKGKYVTNAPAIRLLAPGAEQFGPAIQVSPETLASPVDIHWSAAGLVAQYTVEGRGGTDGYEQHFVRRAADGTFGPPLALPGAETNDYRSTVSGTLAPLPGGDLLAIGGRVSSDEQDSDCFNPIAGTVAASALSPLDQTAAATSQPLSRRGQIALHPQAAVLGDGTVIASWENGANYYGGTRLAAAVRPTGATAFGAARALPYLTHEGGQVLAAGGNQAAIVWAAGSPASRPNLMISTLRASGPYAKFTRLPTHPVTPCDE